MQVAVSQIDIKTKKFGDNLGLRRESSEELG